MLLDDKVPNIRPWAADALGKIGAKAKSAVPALTKWLISKDSTERIMAADALGAIGPEAKTAVPALTELLDSKDSHERCVAAEALGAIGPEGRGAVPVLIKLLRPEYDRGTRLHAVRALGKIGPQAKAAIPDLVDILRGTSSFLDAEDSVFDTLCNMGPAARHVLPELIQYVNTTNSLGRVEHKVNMSGPAMVDLIVLWRCHHDSHVRTEAAQLWKVLGPDDIPSISSFVHSGDPADRTMALEKLCDLGEAARPTLLELMKAADADLCQDILKAMREKHIALPSKQSMVAAGQRSCRQGPPCSVGGSRDPWSDWRRLPGGGDCIGR